MKDETNLNIKYYYYVTILQQPWSVLKQQLTQKILFMDFFAHDIKQMF